jgi:uncharacterized membrane protein YgcG
LAVNACGDVTETDSECSNKIRGVKYAYVYEIAVRIELGAKGVYPSGTLVRAASPKRRFTGSIIEEEVEDVNSSSSSGSSSGSSSSSDGYSPSGSSSDWRSAAEVSNRQHEDKP